MKQTGYRIPIACRARIVLVATVFVAGMCHAQLGPDFGRDENGDVLLLDTPENWYRWTVITDRRIQAELRGDVVREGRASESWNDFWVRHILENANGGRENWPRYTNYIIEKRSEVGLSPLEGLPEWYFEQAAPDDKESEPNEPEPKSSCADASPTCIA